MEPSGRESTAEEGRMGDLVRAHFPGGLIPEFRPFVHYDERMDRIVALIADVSVCHLGSDNVLFLFEENYPAEGWAPRILGFEVQIVHRLTVSTGRVNLHQLLDTVKHIVPQRAYDVERARALISQLPFAEVELKAS